MIKGRYREEQGHGQRCAQSKLPIVVEKVEMYWTPRTFPSKWLAWRLHINMGASWPYLTLVAVERTKH